MIPLQYIGHQMTTDGVVLFPNVIYPGQISRHGNQWVVDISGQYPVRILYSQNPIGKDWRPV